LMVVTPTDAPMELDPKFAGLNWILACSPPIVPVVAIPTFFIWNVIADRVTVLFPDLKPEAATISAIKKMENFFIAGISF